MMAQFTYAVRPRVDVANGAIILDEEFGGLAGDIDTRGETVSRFCSMVVHTRERAMHEALVKLGWTPPPSNMLKADPDNPNLLARPVVIDMQTGAIRPATEDEASDYAKRRRDELVSRAAGEEAAARCTDKAERTTDFDSKAASDAILLHLLRKGACSGEDIVEAAKAAGHTPHDDRAFGSVIGYLSRRRLIYAAGHCQRRRGHGTAGGRLWALSSTGAEAARKLQLEAS